ncbi:cytochrome P460 family protein [methane-oxidizing endosymbiont of Gigantopelta aegis]|uniref:cytochrome P460 family protein n=1 Tax=methane-oxidizing endosymbiont of Gigantopelta aegis TaxID=2794938 RepID=UPI0018DCC859|nr:cytochrome P460 family protein [methane-oxidizing endosymbiont of Gigantopelta aegis]
MSKHIKSLLLAVSLVSVVPTLQAESNKAEGEYKNWRLISIAHREDNKTMRAILGNHIAIKSAQSGKHKTWQDGTILAKVLWKESRHDKWSQAFVPGEFMRAEAMIKDSKKFAKSGGWGFGHWVNGKLEMHDAETSAKCFGCHVIAKDTDYVFHHAVLY